MEENEVLEQLSKPIANVLFHMHNVFDKEKCIQDIHKTLWEEIFYGNEGVEISVKGEDFTKITIFNENSYYNMKEDEDVIFNFKYEHLINRYIILVS